jgi:hypothetical protein
VRPIDVLDECLILLLDLLANDDNGRGLVISLKECDTPELFIHVLQREQLVTQINSQMSILKALIERTGVQRNVAFFSNTFSNNLMKVKSKSPKNTSHQDQVSQTGNLKSLHRGLLKISSYDQIHFLLD